VSVGVVGMDALLVLFLLRREMREEVKIGLRLGRRGLAGTGALQLDARDAVAQKATRTEEQLVVVSLLVAA